MNKTVAFDPADVRERMAAMTPPMIQSDIASALDVTPATVNRWPGGKCKPRRRDIKAIERLLR